MNPFSVIKLSKFSTKTIVEYLSYSYVNDVEEG